MQYLWAFLIGGAICAVAQIFIDKTKLTPARILVGCVVLGVFLSAIGVYGPLKEFAGAGGGLGMPAGQQVRHGGGISYGDVPFRKEGFQLFLDSAVSVSGHGLAQGERLQG